MSQIINFGDSASLGKTGEDRVFKMLENHLPSYQITAATEDTFSRKIDVDFYAGRDGIVSFAGEIKTDRYASGNIVWEKYSTESLQTPGCNEKTWAKWIFYYIIPFDVVLVINNEEFKKYIRKLEKDSSILSRTRKAITTKYGEKIYNSLVYILPIQSIIENGKIISAFMDFSCEEKGFQKDFKNLSAIVEEKKCR